MKVYREKALEKKILIEILDHDEKVLEPIVTELLVEIEKLKRVVYKKSISRGIYG